MHSKISRRIPDAAVSGVTGEGGGRGAGGRVPPRDF